MLDYNNKSLPPWSQKQQLIAKFQPQMSAYQLAYNLEKKLLLLVKYDYV